MLYKLSNTIRKMKRILTIITVITFLLSSCVKSLEKEGVEEAGITILKGRVVEGTNHNPLSNIMVLCTNGSQTHSRAITDAEGDFELEVDYNKIDETYYLLLDGGSDEIRKKEELRGVITSEYDYHDMVLYSLPSFQYGGHTFQVAPDPGNSMTWDNANDYCNALTLYNLSDWRLPTKDELIQMYMERISIGGFSTQSYWSSTNGEQDDYHYWVSFYNGRIENWYDVNSNSVRPIRKAD